MTTPKTDPTTDARTTLLTIDGMTCGSCVRHVQQALVDLAGVHLAEVQLAQKQARVVHESAVRLDDLLQAVADAGYHASVATP